MRLTLRLAACTAIFAVPVATALPRVTTLPSGVVTPSSLTATDVMTEGRAIRLLLPDGKRYTVNGIRSRPATGMAGLAARSADGAVRLYAFVADGKLLSADAYGGFGHYELLETAAGTYWSHARPEPPGADELLIPAPGLPEGIQPAAVAEPGADGKYEIRVLVLHTPLAAERLGSGRVAAEAERLIFLSSAIMDTSAVPVRYTLAGTAPFSGTNEDENYYANLDAMVASDEVRHLRDQTEADLVVLFRSQDGNPTGNGPGTLCGLSNGFNNFERSDPPLSVDPNRDGFNVVGAAPSAAGAACEDNVVAHEMGHSLGGGHDYATSMGFAYWKPYSHAAPCLGSNGNITYFSLMWGLGIGAGGGRGDVFTNPDLLLDGRPCGAEGVPGAEATQANNARAMTEAAPYVAAYRGQSKSVSRSEPARESTGIGSLSLALSLLFALAGLLKLISPESGRYRTPQARGALPALFCGGDCRATSATRASGSA